jgi:hypothetical protein
MKHTRPDTFLTRDLLCVVRDERPTAGEFVARFGDQCYHLLRKHGAIVLEGERIRLSRRHLSPDGLRFVWGSQLIHLDDNVVQHVVWGPGGPPVNGEQP